MAVESTHLHHERKQPLVRHVRVTVVEGPDRDQEVELIGGSLSVGTSPDNGLTLTDPTVSRYHLDLQVGEGILVKDLGSRNGTFVGDVRIREASIPAGARLRLGKTVLTFVDVGVQAVPPPE